MPSYEWIEHHTESQAGGESEVPSSSAHTVVVVAAAIVSVMVPCSTSWECPLLSPPSPPRLRAIRVCLFSTGPYEGGCRDGECHREGTTGNIVCACVRVFSSPTVAAPSLAILLFCGHVAEWIVGRLPSPLYILLTGYCPPAVRRRYLLRRQGSSSAMERTGPCGPGRDHHVHPCVFTRFLHVKQCIARVGVAFWDEGGAGAS
jgi:hypothetical protein